MSGTLNPNGLNPQDIVNVQVSLTPALATATSQNVPLIIGPSPVIDVVERIRTYTGGSAALTTIAAQFGLTAPEYLCAQTFFEYTPQAQIIKIGRWADGPTPAILHGGPLTVSQQNIANFNAITAGSLAVTYGGASHNITGINLTSASTLAQVATLISTAIGAGNGVVTYDPLYARFNFTTTATGGTVTTAFATTAGTGTDISALMNLQSTQGGSLVAGTSGETPVAAITLLRAMDKVWYFAHFTTTYNGVWQDADANLTVAAHVAVAAFIQACSPPSTYGITSNDPNCLLASSTTDIAAEIQAGGYSRTTVYYSSSNAAVALEVFAKFATIDYDASDTATIAMFTALPGVVAETLTEAQASALQGKYGNVSVNYSNGVAIVQNGFMGNGDFFDEIHATDSMAANVQVDIFNYLLTQSAAAKVPQTDPGIQSLVNVAFNTLENYVGSNVIGRNLTWNGPTIGSLNTGDTLPKGIYIYAPSVRSQTQAQRQTRAAPLMQICVNLSGAVQSASAIISVTR